MGFFWVGGGEKVSSHKQREAHRFRVLALATGCRFEEEGWVCLKLRMDYRVQNAVILLTNKRYIMYDSHEGRLREETHAGGANVHSRLHTHTHTHISQKVLKKRPRDTKSEPVKNTTC